MGMDPEVMIMLMPIIIIVGIIVSGLLIFFLLLAYTPWLDFLKDKDYLKEQAKIKADKEALKASQKAANTRSNSQLTASGKNSRLLQGLPAN